MKAGIFRFSMDMVHLAIQDPELFPALIDFFSKVIIIRAVDELHSSSIFYYGFSDLFDHAAEGEIIPEYRVEINTGGYSIQKMRTITTKEPIGEKSVYVLGV